MERHLILILALLLPVEAVAACYADYKAKQDDPLRLHYGVIELPDAACDDRGAARREVARRVARGNWELLSIEGVFDESGLARRRAEAGAYYLRF